MKTATACLLALMGISQKQFMEPARARAVLQDSRYVTLVGAIESAFAVKCAPFAADSIEADVKCRGGGDHSSCYYTFKIPCVGNPALSGLTVKVEFVTPAPWPMNLDIQANFPR